VTRSGVLPDQPIASLADYRALGGGAGLSAALRLPAADVLRIVDDAGLRGRGGAGFPTARKWSSVLEAAGDGHPALVCNAAEGEPGTYKDRALMARNPFQVLEGMLIAARALGASPVVVATKRRYAHEAQRLAAARKEMVDAGWDGADRLEVVVGPDEYLYGEETALLEVIEGKLPMPRILPPYMYGLHATMQSPNPTVVNNVETFAHVADILAHGAEAFRAHGTQEAPGTMVFTVVGDVAVPGVYELPLGTPLRTLLEIAEAEDVKAVYSGVSNAVITPAVLDLPMDFDSFAEAGLGLGSGGFVVYDRSRCIVDVVATLSRFLAVESCAQCPPCKLHGVEIWERLAAVCAGGSSPADLEDIRRRCLLVSEGNRCYLPVGHALVVQSALDAYAEEFAAAVATPHDHLNPVPVPKLDRLEDTAEFDADYHRKRLDWSYG